MWLRQMEKRNYTESYEEWLKELRMFSLDKEDSKSIGDQIPKYLEGCHVEGGMDFWAAPEGKTSTNHLKVISG